MAEKHGFNRTKLFHQSISGTVPQDEKTRIRKLKHG